MSLHNSRVKSHIEYCSQEFIDILNLVSNHPNRVYLNCIIQVSPQGTTLHQNFYHTLQYIGLLPKVKWS